MTQNEKDKEQLYNWEEQLFNISNFWDKVEVIKEMFAANTRLTEHRVREETLNMILKNYGDYTSGGCGCCMDDAEFLDQEINKLLSDKPKEND